MTKTFNYSALLISDSQKNIERAKKITEDIDTSFSIASNLLDALEYLMDHKADIIFLDLSIGKEESFEFLEHISNDYENKFTPIVLLTNLDEIESSANDFAQYNVISTMLHNQWDKQSTKLLNFLRITKLNLFTIQDNLIASEDRGTIDQLTSAYNRYGLENIFHSLMSREKAYSEPFSCVMVDIDHFKRINDTYGHDIGDEVLIDFAKILLDSIRKGDSLIRHGGEEFIILLSNVNKEIAVKSAEKIREKIQNTLHSSKGLQITASFGVVQYTYDDDLEATMKRVDELLYQAKHSGRNQVKS